MGASLALAAPAPTHASSSDRTRVGANLELVGSLTLAWQGDEARGCASAGQCGVSGSLQMLPAGGTLGTPGLPSVEFMDSSSAARVIELSGSGAIESACVDPAPVDFFLSVRRSSSGALRAVPHVQEPEQLPSAGRCAGPTARDLLALALPARRLGRHAFDLSGRTSFRAGPFTVTAISTLRIEAHGIAASISGSIPISVPGKTSTGHPQSARTVLEEHAKVVYRVASTSGALTTTFSGLAGPLCEPLGACGATGVLSVALGSAGVWSFSGSRIVKHRVDARAALEDLRAGRLGLNFTAPEIAETVSESLAGAGGTTCADRDTEAVPLQQVPGPGLTFALDVPTGIPGVGDPLRTRCPGPSSTDILDGSPLATADVSAGVVGAQRPALTFVANGPFLASDYGGERGGSVVISLALERASGGTSRIRENASVPTGL